MHTFGLATDPNTLRDRICEAAKTVSCFFGPYHGDLHPGNIMVRGGDAILIDFSSASDGPLTADPAALEVSLIFGTDEDDKPECFQSGVFVDEVYESGNLTLHPCRCWKENPDGFRGCGGHCGCFAIFFSAVMRE